MVVGRPIVYGLAMGGEEGVEQILRVLLAETEITLGLVGHKDIDEIWGSGKLFWRRRKPHVDEPSCELSYVIHLPRCGCTVIFLYCKLA